MVLGLQSSEHPAQPAPRTDPTCIDTLTILDHLALGSAAGLVLVWVLYPAVIVVAGRFRSVSRIPVFEEEVPRVSIVIATRDAPELVAERVRNCLGSAYPAGLLEIVIATDFRSAHAYEDLSRVSNVLLVQGDEPGGKAAALNAGVRKAGGEVIVFADTGQRFTEDTVTNLVRRLSHPSIGAVTGSLRLPASARSLVAGYWKFERWLRRAEARVHSSVGATGAVYAIRRSLWRPLPTGLILDDVFTPMHIVMAGYRVAFAEDATAEETRNPSTEQEYRRKVRTLTGVLQLCAWCPQVLMPTRNPIWAPFVFHKLLRMLTPYWAILVMLGVMIRSAALVDGVAVPLLIAGSATALWSIGTRHRVGSALRRLIVEGFVIQAAVLVAGFNGLRGRWQVWDA